MIGQRIGYIRVSTFEQNPDRQLENVALARTFTDKASGKDTKRPQFDALVSFSRTGDTLVVHSMDRLARNLDDLRSIVQRLTQQGVRIEFIKEGLTFSGEDSAMAILILSVMGAFAEFERTLIGERQREGIALAKKKVFIRVEKKLYLPSECWLCVSKLKMELKKPSWLGNLILVGKHSTSSCLGSIKGLGVHSS